LKMPLLPTTPSERIVYLWEYVRITLEDTGLEVPPSDAVLETMERVRGEGADSEDFKAAGDIYMRARYDMVLQPHDAVRMRMTTDAATKALRKTIPMLRRMGNWWRVLA
jgi:hypothetical protein